MLFRRLDVGQQRVHRLFALAGLIEALVMHHADLLDASGMAQCVVRVVQIQAALIGCLGGVEIADSGENQVSMAEVEFCDGFSRFISGSPMDADGLLQALNTLWVTVFPLDVAKDFN